MLCTVGSLFSYSYARGRFKYIECAGAGETRRPPRTAHTVAVECAGIKDNSSRSATLEGHYRRYYSLPLLELHDRLYGTAVLNNCPLHALWERAQARPPTPTLSTSSTI